jgi:hypothetical protein
MQVPNKSYIVSRDEGCVVISIGRLFDDVTSTYLRPRQSFMLTLERVAMTHPVNSGASWNVWHYCHQPDACIHLRNDADDLTFLMFAERYAVALSRAFGDNNPLFYAWTEDE